MTQSNPNNHNLKHEFSCQSRLGLVLYGGVSLAIYMNGICQEFYNAVRGRGIYKLIKAVTNSDIIIDIISGTSAGGINGVFLSYALANSDQNQSVNFKDFANIWRESGDIEHLLRDPDKSKVEKVNSILNGEGYYQTELKEIFTKAKFEAGNNHKDEWYSDFRELDLFITGTDLLGKIEKTWDNLGNEIETKNHQTVFHLKSRKDATAFRGNPFECKDENTAEANESTAEALAKLCRITSCFPLAFPVVEVEVNSEDEVDSKLVEWGQLKNRLIPEGKEDNYTLYFADGGVLDNRPFSYTISAIAGRQAYQPVDRKLFYIDPNPEKFENQPEFNDPKKPNVWKVALDSLITLPSYESIDKDLKRIKDLNQKVYFYTSLRQSILKSFRKGISNTRKNGLEAKKKDTTDEYEYYLNLRLLGLLVQLLPKTSKIKDNQTTKQDEEILNEVSQFLSKQTLQSQKFLSKYHDCLEKVDLNFTYRKHCFLIYAISEQIKSLREENEIIKLQRLQYQVTWQLKLIEVLRESLEEILFSIDVTKIIKEERNAENIAEFLIIFHLTLLRGENFDSSSILDKYFEELDKVIPKKEDFKEFKSNIIKKQEFSENLLRKIYELPICKFLTIDNKTSQKDKLKDFESKIKENFNHNNFIPENFRAETHLIQKIDAHLNELIEEIGLEGKYKDLIWEIFRDFKTIDAILYPYEALADLKARSPIQLVRISPEDTKFGFGKDKKISDKLTGHQFRAFGGFFKKSWRSNDLLWGRLDGLNYLVEALVTKDSVQKFKSFINNNCPKQKTKEEYIEFLVDNCLKDTQYDEIKPKIKDDFNKIYKIDSDNIPSDDLINDLRENLVKAGHKEILDQDLKQVMEDAISQQVNWNTKVYKTKNPFPSKSHELNQLSIDILLFKSVKGFFDPIVTTFVAEKLVSDYWKELKSKEREDKFLHEYKIPKEKVLSDIPKNLSNRRLEKTALILLDMLVSSFPDQDWPVVLKQTYTSSRGINQGIGKWTVLVIFPIIALVVHHLSEAGFTLLEVILIIIMTFVLTIPTIFLFLLPFLILPLLRYIVLNYIIKKQTDS